MRMHLLSGGRLRMRARGYFPRAERGETFELPVSCALFKHAQGNALFDTGCHPDAATNAVERWGEQHAGYSVPIFAREDAVASQLHHAGLTAGDVDLVICSHLHYDHCSDYVRLFLTRWDQGADKIPELKVFGPPPIRLLGKPLHPPRRNPICTRSNNRAQLDIPVARLRARRRHTQHHHLVAARSQPNPSADHLRKSRPILHHLVRRKHANHRLRRRPLQQKRSQRARRSRIPRRRLAHNMLSRHRSQLLRNQII